ncbi:Predicted arabinose efflux permease, MFS family [Burkholderia sp. GAS332]|uniref:MFS transporter n=1 Tax=Paraburkholderia sediminicola TaxID=458836 RepID=UPI0009270194|nr:Predicted arabinose efflux permease, MFS family [Burkholderia sp. GAS332]
MSPNTVGSESPAQSAAPEEPGLTHQLDSSLLMVMAVACGVFVANIYYNQPILELLQQAFPRSPGLVNLVPTATQLGFACGLFFLVPLGDRIDRRKLILGQTALLIVALVCLAAAPNAWLLVIASAVVGIAGSVAQQVVPFAAELAGAKRRGQVVGTVMSGLLCGILLGRAVGGFTADHWGWRATFWLGAAMTAIVWVMLLVRLPHSEPKTRHSYFRLMKSLIELWREEPSLRRATCIQAAMFGSFIGLWTILALRLHEAFGLGADVAGLMGIVGAAGILIAPLAGRVADRRGPHAVIGLGCLIMLLSYAVLGLWGSLVGLIVGIILLDFGEQSALISNQHVVYALRPEARSRLNTLFMSGMFVGGAAGSWGASLSWRLGGWHAACVFGGALALLGFVLHFSGRLAAYAATRS